MVDDDFVKVADIKEIPNSHMKEVQIDGKDICLVNVNGKYFAIGNICTHEGGPLADGTLQGHEVECPWHGSKFDVRTGEVTNPPASEPEPTYEVSVDGNSILIRKLSTTTEQQLPQQALSPAASEYELVLLEKQKYQGTDVMSFRFTRQQQQEENYDDIRHKHERGNDNKERASFLNYTAGQYAFFDIGGVYNDPRGPIRHFTISSSPTEENSIMITTRIRDTPYKKRLSALEKGTKVKVRGPQGKFTLQGEDYSKTAVFLSGGIGVTPFRSMIKYATDKQLPMKILMFDSNRNQENTLFKNEFDQCIEKNKNLKIIYTITEEQQDQASSSMNEWKGEKGRIDKAMLTKYLDNNELKNSIFYTCGPPGMTKAMQKLLEEDLLIPKEQIKVEEFTGY